MSDILQIQRELLSPPGDTLGESLEERGMSPAELARRIGRPKEKVKAIICGREGLSAPTAYKLEETLGIPASFWLKRESAYRRALDEIEKNI